jgi:hypothetical protein
MPRQRPRLGETLPTPHTDPDCRPMQEPEDCGPQPGQAELRSERLGRREDTSSQDTTEGSERGVSIPSSPDTGQCGPQDSNLQPRDSSAPAFPRGLDYLTLPRPRSQIATRRTREAGRSRRGLLLGLTPLVSEPSWSPMPDQVWLRITMPCKGLGFPQFTRIASGGYPPAPPIKMSPLLCR